MENKIFQELHQKELKKIEGGNPFAREILKGIIIGLGIGAGLEIMGDWDDFKDGFASAFN